MASSGRGDGPLTPGGTEVSLTGAENVDAWRQEAGDLDTERPETGGTRRQGISTLGVLRQRRGDGHLTPGGTEVSPWHPAQKMWMPGARCQGIWTLSVRRHEGRSWTPEGAKLDTWRPEAATWRVERHEDGYPDICIPECQFAFWTPEAPAAREANYISS
ncbi:hypothetical protein BGX38DRAFT_1273418 [Terfezia claveryi]|nr:hypothetical protein BGX38DRAFT_1273418 [Terfezia claveryi]